MFFNKAFQDLLTAPRVGAHHLFPSTPLFVCFIAFQSARPITAFVFILTGDLEAFDLPSSAEIAEYFGRSLATVGAGAHPLVRLRDARLTEHLTATLDLVSFSGNVVTYHTCQLVG
jgi:hypothetical protein